MAIFNFQWKMLALLTLTKISVFTSWSNWSNPCLLPALPPPGGLHSLVTTRRPWHTGLYSYTFLNSPSIEVTDVRKESPPFRHPNHFRISCFSRQVFQITFLGQSKTRWAKVCNFSKGARFLILWVSEERPINRDRPSVTPECAR